MKLLHTALLAGLIALLGATAWAQAPDNGDAEGPTRATIRPEAPAGEAATGSASDSSGPGETSGDVSEKLKSDALESLIEGGKADAPAARREDGSDSTAQPKTTSRRTEPSRRETTSRSEGSGRTSPSTRTGGGAVPVVPSSPTETVTIPSGTRRGREATPATANAVEAPRSPSRGTDEDRMDDASDVLVPEPTDADLRPPAALDASQTPALDASDAGAAGALNGAPPEAGNVPATDTAGSRSPASAILIGVLVLAGLLVAAAVVVTVLNSNKAAAPEAMAATPPVAVASVPEYAYLTAPDAPNIPVSAAPFVMGSSPSCDLRLADPKASPQHAEIDRTDEGWLLTDLGSLNGTFLNGERIASPVLLQAGDEVRMGDIVVNFETED
jgi:hypothetical protein